MRMSPTAAREHLLAGKKSPVRVDGEIDMSDTELQSIDCSVACHDLNLSNTKIERLPARVKVRSRLILDNCQHLSHLPAGLTCGSLSLRGCRFLERLPERLSVWYLDLSECPGLTSWPKQGSVQNGCLRLRNCVEVRAIPEWIGPLGQLDVAGCVNLHELPAGLKVSGWIDIGGSSVLGLPRSLQNTPLRWRSVPITHRIAFQPESITAQEALAESNAELRRVMIERMGYLNFANDAEAKVIDSDSDAGGQRQLLKIDLQEDEPLVGLSCCCPSTGRQYFLRVPPATKTCHQAAAWMAGFDDPALYQPTVET